MSPGLQSDSEPFHPAEPDPTLDGPTVDYGGTVSVSSWIDARSRYPLLSGGAIEIDHLTGPVNPKYPRVPRKDGTDSPTLPG